MLAANCLLFSPAAPPTGRCVVMKVGSMWSELRAYRATEFKGEDGMPSAKQRTRKRDALAAWTETQSSRFQEMLEPVQPFLRNLRPPIRRVPPDADEYIPGPGLALTVVWDRQGPFVVATDDSASSRLGASGRQGQRKLGWCVCSLSSESRRWRRTCTP